LEGFSEGLNDPRYDPPMADDAHPVWLWVWRHRRPIFGALLGLAGLAVTIRLATSANSDDPPSVATNVVLVLVTAAFQLGSAWLFMGAKPPVVHGAVVRGAIRRATGQGDRVQKARLLAEEAREKALTRTELRAVVGELGVHLSYIEDGYVDGVQDWLDLALQLEIEDAGKDGK